MREPAKRGVYNGAANRRQREKVSWTDDIRQIKQRAQQRAGDESDLHGQR